MDLGLILATHFADKRWVLNGDDYSGLSWLDESKKPTEKDLEKLWPATQITDSLAKVDKLREAAYREISDPLFFRYQRGEIEKQEWLDAVQSIKEKYPNPYS